MAVVKFTAIEGLRGWLACTVVMAHLVQTSDLFQSGIGQRAWHAGRWAVVMFIIISGFVITHLIIEKREPYIAYIGQRFMRLFPAYSLAVLIGTITLPFHLWAMEQSS